MPNEETVSVDEASRILRAHSQRVTLQRLIILQSILRQGGHVPSETIYRYVASEHPYIDKSTVYRNLASLVEAGIISHIEAHSGAYYELTTDERHIHLACLTCGHMMAISPEDERRLEKEIFASYGFKLAHDQATFPARCLECTTDPTTSHCHIHADQTPGQHTHTIGNGHTHDHI